ncbi:MAG: squalene/phytoene synthase family protein [Elusimicrobia bacterium]|nr:squalene/phytoene synthase family protein [Elusimicrobiota bacterium]
MTPRWNDRFPSRLGFADAAARRRVRALYRMALEAEGAAMAGEGKRLDAWRRWLAAGGAGEAPERTPAEALEALRGADLDARPLEAIAAAWHEDALRRGVETLDQLERHARGTSGAVGRLALRLAGIGDAKTLELAEALWTATALTALIRDTRSFVAAGRVYLPAELLAEHGYGEADLRMGVVNDRFRAVMKEVWKRVRGLYEESRPLPRRLTWPVSAEVRYGWSTGAALLARISQGGFDVLHARPALSRWEPPRLAVMALLPL